MQYKKGFNIKPKEVKSNGKVIFTDGTNDLVPNQVACEAYGYDYDRGACTAFKYSTGLQMKFESEKVLINGDGNKKTNSRGCFISGTENEISSNMNCSVSGLQNKIDLGVNNASVIGGKLGKATIAGEVVIGGGDGDGTEVGQQQMSIISLSGITTGSDITLYALGDDDEDEQITLPDNSISIYELYITGLCTGGSAGTAGHFKTKRILGSLLVDEDGAITRTETISTNTGYNGDTGTISIVTSAANIFSVQIAGRADTAVNWSAVVKLYINQTVKVDF